MDAPKPSDFEELKAVMLKQTNGDERRAAVRLLSFGVLWCLAVKILPSILIDLVELLRFEMQRLRNEP